MLPLNAGFLAAGPVSGWLSDEFGARPFATRGMLLAARTFAALLSLPVNFGYAPFGLLIFLNGIAFGHCGTEHDFDHEQRARPLQRGRLRDARHFPKHWDADLDREAKQAAED